MYMCELCSRYLFSLVHDSSKFVCALEIVMHILDCFVSVLLLIMGMEVRRMLLISMCDAGN